jgi:hypothetical protein
MARIRTIKPEFWTSEQVMQCSPLSRLLFIGIWNFCDDAGNHPLSAITIKALVFPGDAIAVEEIRRMLDELSASGLLSFYAASGKQYLHVNGWGHQKIDKPTVKFPPFESSKPPHPPETPAPNEGMRAAGDVVDDAPHINSEALGESSASASGALTPGREGEGKGNNTHTLGAPFAMHLAWQPDESALKAYALINGLPRNAFTPEACAAFICHHEAKGTCKTEKEWVSDLVGWVRRDRVRDARVVPLRQGKPGGATDEDFQDTGWLGQQP